MPIPNFQAIMRPLLVHLANGQERGTNETLNVLADEFHLSEDELRQLLPSRRQPLFRNRVAWAKFYLKKAGAVESPRKGVYRITDRGRQLLKTAGPIDTGTLQQFPEFRDFLSNSKAGAAPVESVIPPVPQPAPLSEDSTAETQTPEELLALGHSQLTAQLNTDLLERIKAGTPEFFERLVVDLLLALGYGGSRQDAGQIIGGSGDEGIDGVIKEDKLGLDTIYIQAKRWGGVVGRPELQKFAGALQGKKARKGVFITTSSFTKEAEQYAKDIETKIVLIDGRLLAKLMIEHNVGVTPVATYEIKRIDSDYFSEE